MSIRSVIKVAEKYAIDNSPTLISAMAATGAIGTTWLAIKATFKAGDILQQERDRRDLSELEFEKPIERKDAIKLVWKEYIPPALALTGTIACIVTANSISASRLAGMAAAYKLTEKQYDEYKDKVKEKLGLKDEKALRDEIAQDGIDKQPPSAQLEASLSEGEVLFREAWTGRYFKSEMHIVKGAENTLTRELIRDTYATLSDFYDLIGLERTQESSEVGWSLENPIELDFSTALYRDRPIVVMEYAQLPHAIKSYMPMYLKSDGERCREDLEQYGRDLERKLEDRKQSREDLQQYR